MKKIYNFSAGPAALPKEVLLKAEAELLSFGESGVSVMEMNHRSPEFMNIMGRAEAALRELMHVPENYKILFVQGGATMQFSAIPLNLFSERRCADYIISGQFSKSAYIEAKKYGDVVIAASSAGASPVFSTVPQTKRSDFRPDADYVHVCYNNTVYGTKFNYIPDTGNIPLVADMSSCILSEPTDVSKFALIYASAQKNIGTAGLTVVIIREDLLGKCRQDTPALLDYKLIADNNSMYNTPPVWQIYIAALTFEHILEIGGLDEMKRRNERKASILYDYIDAQTYYTSPTNRECRSMMNVIFYTGSAELDRKFIKEAEAQGLLGLKGHESIGGMRASIYNAMSAEGVERLVVFMKSFAAENPKFNA